MHSNARQWRANSRTIVYIYILLFIQLTLFSSTKPMLSLPYVFENDNEQAGYVFSQYLHYDTEILSFFLHPDVDFSQVEY